MAGQAPVCLTCYSHHFAPRIKKGAPIQPMLSEGVGEVGGSVRYSTARPIRTRLCFGRVGRSVKKDKTFMPRPAKLRLTPMSSRPRKHGRQRSTCCPPLIIRRTNLQNFNATQESSRFFWTDTWLADFRWLREAQFARYTKNYLQLMKLNFHGQWSIVFIKYYI